MLVTSPSVMPRKSTGEPTDRPRTEALKYITYCSATTSGLRNAVSRSSNSVSTVSGDASGNAPAPGLDSGGVWKASPPTSTVTSDSVLIFTPLASTAMSMPLACQNRVLAVT